VGERLVTTPIAEAGSAARVVPEERWQIPQVLCD
jgi:hypothetical protein